MIRLSTLLLLAVILFSACGTRNPPLIPALNPGKVEDSETVAFAGTLRTADTNWYMSDDGMTQIAAFNKADFPQAKSIGFATMIRTSSSTNKVYAQLYNLTDSIPISNAELSANCECFRWVETEDIMKDLPDKPVMLGLRIRSEKEDYFVSTNYNSFLMIFNR